MRKYGAVFNPVAPGTELIGVLHRRRKERIPVSTGHHHHAPASYNAAFAIGIGLNIACVAIEAFYGWKVVWAMGTDEIALTAHLVMPEGGGDDTFLKHATEELHEHFEIRHVTLQVMREPFKESRMALAPAHGPGAVHRVLA